MAELLATDEGVLPDPGSILKSNWSRSLSIFPEVTFPDICNYLLGKTDEYSEETLKSFKSLTAYKLFKDGHVLDLQVCHLCEVSGSTNRKIKDGMRKGQL